MPRSVRDDSGDAVGASERDLYERIGAARADLARAERELAELRARNAELDAQIEAVQIENSNLERDLLKRLHEWRKLDDTTARADDVLPQLRSVTSSFSYRAVRFGLHGVNRVLQLATLPLRALRRR